MRLQPNSIFADEAFQQAEDSGRWLVSLTMHPQALNELARRLRNSGLTRATGFSIRTHSKGRPRNSSARYRGVEIRTDRSLENILLAEYSDGSRQKLIVNPASRPK